MKKCLFNIQDKVAFITGGRRGLGKAMVLALAEAGARIAVVAKSEEANELRSEIELIGAELLYLSADLTKREEREGLINKVVSHYGKIDILVNNAGFQHRAEVLDYPLDQWDLDLSLMVTSVFELSKQAGKFMILQGGGKIIHIASISSFQGARQIVGYATAKHALVGLTKCLANEWAAKNINVNAIAPGLFETDMAAHVIDDPVRSQELRGRIPAGHFGKPDDLVGPLLFLASDASRHVHGHILIVDGGWMGR